MGVPLSPGDLPTPNKRKHARDDDDTTGTPTRKKTVKTCMGRKQCIVCSDDAYKNQFPKLPHDQNDNDIHGSDVCFKCFKAHLSVEVKNKGPEAVSCPQCKHELAEPEVRKLAWSATYHEYVIAIHIG